MKLFYVAAVVLLSSLSFGQGVSLFLKCTTDGCTSYAPVPVHFPPGHKPPPPSGQAPKGVDWGYFGAQLNQFSQSIEFSVESGLWYNPPQGYSEFSMDLPRGETTILGLDGNFSGIPWCAKGARPEFLARIYSNDPSGRELLYMVKIDQQTSPFFMPVSVTFPAGIKANSLTFLFYDDVCKPVTMSWGLTFRTSPTPAKP
jgi:hypothetical protein